MQCSVAGDNAGLGALTRRLSSWWERNLEQVVNILDFVIRAAGAITSSSSMEMSSPLVAKNPDTFTDFLSYSSVMARSPHHGL